MATQTVSNIFDAAVRATDYLSRDDVVTNSIVACGMIDGIIPSRTSLESPFSTFGDMLLSASLWTFCFKAACFLTINRFYSVDVSKRWFAFIPALSVASVIYRKYRAICHPLPTKTQANIGRFNFSNENGVVTFSVNTRMGDL